ncbi:IclR family transcriptional regulator domain-containing protein [Halegenticoccus tardaugens]|uniref:IclR family transcriptional regulator domain-containing protein n=1 Tax=Halegenticoccus tardaugens TaxID=2071624 RepID=UPI002263BEBC|nr:IclR family transcriptional regulator C-terminal domain-containing protein [Halegenticoccus tardaugens]
MAVPITDTDGDVLGALSVAGPTYRLQNVDRETRIADLLLDISNELELNVSYSRF